GESLVVTDAAGAVYAFDGGSGAVNWCEENVHEGGALTAAVHPSGDRFATAGQDGRVLVWRGAEPDLDLTLDVGRGWIENVAWSPDGEWLAATCSRQVCVYDASGSEVWRSDDHPSTVSAIAWAGRKELATACYGRVAFIDVATGDARQTLEWKGSLVSMVLSPDGDVVACGSQDNTVHFWRRSTGLDSMMSGYPGKPSSLAFDSTGTLLATSGGPSVTVWRFEGNGPEGTQPGVLRHHEKTVTTLAFAANGRSLATGARDGSVAVWAIDRDGEGDEVGSVELDGAVAQLCWRPDGQALAALDGRGGVTVWWLDS
ncbi:MAG: PQQ-binding-like beta-propeller repeat protein, partial [Planctomycetota bacterium]